MDQTKSDYVIPCLQACLPEGKPKTELNSCGWNLFPKLSVIMTEKWNKHLEKQLKHNVNNSSDSDGGVCNPKRFVGVEICTMTDHCIGSVP